MLLSQHRSTHAGAGDTACKEGLRVGADREGAVSFCLSSCTRILSWSVRERMHVSAQVTPTLLHWWPPL